MSEMQISTLQLKSDSLTVTESQLGYNLTW